MLTELIELGCKMKEQMEVTQSEIKQNIQGTNSNRKETRSQSNDLEQKEKNKHPSRSKWRKKNSEKWRESYKPLGQLETFQYLNYRGTRRRRTTARNQKLIWTNNEGKLPQSGKGNRLPGSPESPKEVRRKEEHTKARTSSLSYPRLKTRREP